MTAAGLEPEEGAEPAAGGPEGVEPAATDTEDVPALAEVISLFRGRAAAAPVSPLSTAELMKAADVREREERLARRERNRRARFEKRRPVQYASAGYGALSRTQDPRGRVSSWWERGPRVLALVGLSRRGKTRAAYAIANHVHDQGRWVEVWTASDLWMAMRAGEDGPEPNAYEYALACDLLVLDDLGREKPTDAWIEKLHGLLNARLGAGGRLVVTANATANVDDAWAELIDKYGDPPVERILDGAGVVIVTGPKWRDIAVTW